ncbi:sulfatase family protein [Parashewanella tropica]|uniref:sulfatase family protein n=1 Tax=Parashewanella tropica TaxID=2547970 RepID=UPI00105952FF|nr:arylsulfatase [Parashewanella tropica]
MAKKLTTAVATALVLLSAGCSKQSTPESSVEKAATEKQQKPNLIVLYVDDLGYGDVGAYGAKGVETPNIDKLAAGGVMFTDAHSSSATCTPSRYSLLTGEHGFRNDAAILPGDAPLLIRPGKKTLPSLLKQQGYATAVVGKWHLGLGNGSVDWNTDVKPGPLEIGFDYSFLLPATGDRVPTVYLENHNVVNLDKNDPITVSYHEKVGNKPTGLTHPELLKYPADLEHSETIVNGISRMGSMTGGEKALWKDEEFADIFTEKAVKFIRANKNQPFFLFHSYHDIHVPRMPHERFKGKSSMGPRGDAIVQMDWISGEIVKELERLGIDDNTMIVFTSDNGPVLHDGYFDQAKELVGDHKPGGVYRGGKYGAYEGATRVPTIVYWKGKIQPTESDALISQMDLYASFAKLINAPLAEGEAQDSHDFLDVFMGKSHTAREYLIEESVGTTSLRYKNWKLIDKASKIPDWIADKKMDVGFSNEPQLFDLSKDPSEKNDIAAEHPELVKQLQQKIQDIKQNGY